MSLFVPLRASRFALVYLFRQTERRNCSPKWVPILFAARIEVCGVDAILLMSGSEAILIVGSGFQPNSDVTMDSESKGEAPMAGRAGADTDGRYVSAILVRCPGAMQGGVTRVNLKAAMCSPS